MKKAQIKNIMLIITFTIALVFFFVNLSYIWGIIDKILGVLAPILYGLIIAYVLNYPFRFFRDRAFSKMGTKRKWLVKLRTPLALLVSYLIVLGIFVMLISILIPELTASVNTLIDNIPAYARTIKSTSDDIVAFIQSNTGYNLYEMATYNDIVGYLTGESGQKLLTNFLTSTLPSAAIGIGYTLYNWLLGIIISIYLLSSKETLLRQSRKLIVAYTPEKFNRFLFKVGDVLNNKCGKFIIGRLIDSTIIGIMCFIGMSIFQFHYAPLISVLIGLSNMIPFFGPFIGAIPSAFLLLIVDPMEALWFLVFDIILQQFDGNILGPKILGESVGVSGFWIMVSVIVGGGLFGIPGMVLGVPVFAAIYTLVSEGVANRLKKKELKAQTAAAETDPAPSEPPEEPSAPPENTQ